jgi:hypothetical protein
MLVKKKVSLEFLGEEYKEGYLCFKSLSVAEYEKLQKEFEKFEQDSNGSLQFTLNLLKDHYIGGIFPDEKGVLKPVDASELGDLDGGSLVRVLQDFTGVTPNPKVETA